MSRCNFGETMEPNMNAENAALAAFKDPIATAEKHLRHLCSAIEWSDKKYSDTGEHLTVETTEARAVADVLRAIANPEPVARTPMTYPDALARLHRRASTFAGQSDPYIRGILPPVPMEWATPTERQEWREMVIALTSPPFLPADHPIPYAVRSYVRAVADTTPADADPGENDDAELVPVVAMNVEGASADQDGRPIEPHDLDFYDDPEWCLSVGTPWHADRCGRDYFRHARPVQTGDCDP